MVIVVHWEDAPSKLMAETMPEQGPNHWTMYVYIYPGHRLFARMEEVESGASYGEATDSFPFHGGCTYFERSYDSAGNLRHAQVGCDYQHYRDERFSHYHTKEEAAEVFSDADDLLAYCEGTEP